MFLNSRKGCFCQRGVATPLSFFTRRRNPAHSVSNAYLSQSPNTRFLKTRSLYNTDSFRIIILKAGSAPG